MTDSVSLKNGVCNMPQVDEAQIYNVQWKKLDIKKHHQKKKKKLDTIHIDVAPFI